MYMYTRTCTCTCTLIHVHVHMYLPSFDEDFMKLSKVCDIQILANTHTIGVNVSIRRTITPAKYTADTAYNTTRWINR